MFKDVDNSNFTADTVGCSCCSFEVDLKDKSFRKSNLQHLEENLEVYQRACLGLGIDPIAFLKRKPKR